MPRLTAGLLSALILPFLLFPLYHFHAGNVHGHPGQLQLHESPGHFHSDIFETVAHRVFHPVDPELDRSFHPVHSAPGHDSEELELYLDFGGAPPLKAHFSLKRFSSSILFETPQPSFFYFTAVKVPSFEPSAVVGPYSTRSPPSLFV
ncbi:MAG: hypothetical protein ACE5GQ_08880 [Nitrospinales bacterium]